MYYRVVWQIANQQEEPELVQATEKKLGTGAVNQFLTNDHTLS